MVALPLSTLSVIVPRSCDLVLLDGHVLLERLVALGAGELDRVVARRQVADLLGEGPGLLVVDVELHAGLRAADLDAARLRRRARA